MDSENPRFAIVGVGASAGGIEALEGFFRGLPGNPGLSIVIITHLNPHRKSLLHEIVARYTPLSVEVVADDMHVTRNVVYVVPSDAIVTIEDGRFKIRIQTGEHHEPRLIDIFFGSLALDQNERAAGVVLSGGDGDGTLGIKAIKERGGLTLAQVHNADGPRHSSMPDSAISTGLIDYAVTAEEMGQKLVAFSAALEDNEQPLAETGTDSDEAVRQDVYGILRRQMGHDFAGYKVKTFMRRVRRRMQITQQDSVDAYVAQLHKDPQEVAALFRDLLINVTSFFRDADAFESLAKLVIPKLFDGRGAGETVRVWIPGCSTGEEVYSIAILLREHMDTLSYIPRVQIFATDIDEHALAVARAARYPAALLDGVSPERRNRFFLGDSGSLQIAKDVRDLCIFSPHSVVRDPPFSRIDLVSCRNLLIYFGAEVQNQVVPTFHYALRPGGTLFLGTSENVSQFSDLFTPIDKKHRLFRSRSETSSPVRVPLSTPGLRAVWPRKDGGRPLSGGALRHSVDAQVLDRFAPAHVVVNQDGDIVYYSVRTGKYLEPAAGQPNRQILSMARKGLRLDLHTALRDANETNRAVVRSGVTIEGDDGRMQLVTLTVDPLRDRDDSEPMFVVLFEDDGPTLSREDAVDRARDIDSGTALQLERELREARERLQSMMEEYETAIEELKSSNEELVSVNEELQSSNEELEASKEELHSLNEELQTINGELNGKIDALDRANTDLQNLFESAELATVFLDRNLVIRSFTPAATRLFNMLPVDRGRPITDLSSRIDLPGFPAMLASVLRDGNVLEERIEHEEGKLTYLMRVSAYRDLDLTISGVVVTFVDITSLTHAESHQRILIAELQHRTRNLLGVVQALAQQTLGRGGSLESYMHRLSALGRVQSLVSHALNDEIDLRELVDLELQAHATPDDGRVHLSGPRVALGAQQVQTFALALHELATNAVKHGALRAPDGRLAVTWTTAETEAGSQLLLDWVESNVVPPPDPSAKSGYGRTLIERALVFALRAQTRLEFREDGVSCRIEIPLGKARGGR